MRIMKITGIVGDGFKSYLIDWTITEDGIESHGGSLDISGLSVSGMLTLQAETEEALAPTDSYNDMTVVDLKVLLSQRDLPIYGNKDQLIERLREWDASNPDGLVGAVAEDSGESSEATVVDESEVEVVE
tara:strand:+ start:1862 stop:2251 length:390 start_codon:yes stop_codon:yes gene_type:complete